MKFFFTPEFIAKHPELLINNFEIFSFNKKQERFFVDVMKNSEYFLDEPYRKMVYKLITTKLSDPQLYMESFPEFMLAKDVELYNSLEPSSLHFRLNKKALEGLSLSCDYNSNLMIALVEGRLKKMSEMKDLLSFDGCCCLPRESSQDYLQISFWRDSGDLLKSVFGKYIINIFNEKEYNTAISYLEVNEILEKIILEEKIKMSVLPIKRCKV